MAIGKEGVIWGKRVASYCNQWGLCGVVILCREGWRRGSAQATLGFLWVHMGDRHLANTVERSVTGGDASCSHLFI